jgi:alpha-tubulin suppressor-like RCC1 family protein
MGVGSQVCGVTTTGAGYCWSRWNGYGQLGTSSTTASFVPTAVSGGLSLVAISASELYNTCGVTTSGAAYCWGLNEFGQLGLGSTTGPQRCGLTGSAPFPAGDPNNLACSLAPAKVVGGLTLTKVTAGAYFACGLTPSGAAHCWGLNGQGQLGNGGTSDSTCYNGPPGYGLLGTNQDSVPCNPEPVAVSGGLAFTSISAGFQHACAVTSSGAAYCWGQNYYGELGNGTTDSSAVPVPVTGGLSFVTIGAGHAHTCALTTSGAAYCWGAMFCGGPPGVTYGCVTPL